jgi:hypothetical protein
MLRKALDGPRDSLFPQNKEYEEVKTKPSVSSACIAEDKKEPVIMSASSRIYYIPMKIDYMPINMTVKNAHSNTAEG